MLKIKKCGHKDAEKYYSLIGIDFDREVIINRFTFHKAMLTGALEMLIFYDDETENDVGYAVLLTKGLYGYVLLKYFAIFPWCRNRGYGSNAMNLIEERFADKQGIIAEITDFNNSDPERQVKLSRFFAYYGYINPKSDYLVGGLKTRLMVKQGKGTANIGPVAHRIIRDLYSGLLSQSSIDSLLEIKK